jgi:hypothetical protein
MTPAPPPAAPVPPGEPSVIRPRTILSSMDDWKKLEPAVGRLFSDIFRLKEPRTKANFTEWVLTDRGKKRGYEFQMDLLVTYGVSAAGASQSVYDLSGRQHELLLDLEPTHESLEHQPGYVAKKVSYLARLLDGDLPKIFERLTMKVPMDKIDRITTKDPCTYLGLVAPAAQKLPSAPEVRKELQRIDGKYGWTQEPSPDGRQAVAKSASGQLINVGLVPREKLIEFAFVSEALRQLRRPREVHDRFLYEVTALIGPPLLFAPPEPAVQVENYSTGPTSNVAGHALKTVRFSMDPKSLARATTVPRLIDDSEYVQRLPNGEHLSKMAATTDSGEAFPTPVILAVSEDTGFEPNGKTHEVTLEKSAPLFHWQVIDGQHRVFSHYLTTVAHPPPLEVTAYIITAGTPVDKLRRIVSTIFYDVNFRGLTPDADLALAHAAMAPDWATGWRNKKDDRVAYSARVLATRFLYELSETTYFRGMFQSIGYRAPAQLPISSISTYLGGFFDFPRKATRKSPETSVLRYYGPTGPGRLDIPEKPTVEKLLNLGLFKQMADDMTKFAQLIEPNRQEISDLCARQNNVFTALYMLFVRYRLENARPLDALPAAEGAQLTGVGTYLRTLAHPPVPAPGVVVPPPLSGRGSPYGSANGWKKLLDEMLTAFNTSGPIRI